jgi:hypothetical protein
LGVLITLDTNPYVRQDPLTSRMNSEETIILRELSQILASTEISYFQEEYTLVAAKSVSNSLELLEESRSYELQNDFPCQTVKEVENLWTASNGGKSLTPEIKESSTSISTDPLCTSETNHPEEEDFHGMMKESI